MVFMHLEIEENTPVKHINVVFEEDGDQTTQANNLEILADASDKMTCPGIRVGYVKVGLLEIHDEGCQNTRGRNFEARSRLDLVDDERHELESGRII